MSFFKKVGAGGELSPEVKQQIGKIPQISSQLAEQAKQVVGGTGILTESFSAEDVKKFKSLLIDYVVYWYYPSIGITKAKENIQQLQDAGINVLLSVCAIDDASLPTFVSTFSTYENIVGWVAMDEPDGHRISIEDQESRIDIMRSLTKLPLCVTCYTMNYPVRLISKEFDYYFIDSYITDTTKKAIDNGTHVNFQNYFDFFSIPHFSIGGLVGMEKCIPMLQAFQENRNDIAVYNFDTTLKIWNEMSSIYNGNACFFLYDAEETNPYPTGFQQNVKYNTDLQNAVRTFSANLKTGLNHNRRLLAKPTEFLRGKTEEMLTQMMDLYSPLSNDSVIIHPHIDPNIQDNSGYDFRIGGIAVLDFGEKVKDLYFRATLRQEANANPVKYKFHKLIGSNLKTGNLLDEVEVVTSLQYNKKFENFNSRYLVVSTDNDDSSLNGYVTMTQPSILGKRY